MLRAVLDFLLARSAAESEWSDMVVASAIDDTSSITEDISKTKATFSPCGTIPRRTGYLYHICLQTFAGRRDKLNISRRFRDAGKKPQAQTVWT
jgi:hypothetical protein